MTDQTEALAQRIRVALGTHNDPREPVEWLVKALAADITSMQMAYEAAHEQSHQMRERAIAAEARLAEARRDAERYRWLRDCDCPFNVYLYGGADDTGWSPECGSSLDKAIDTAMQEGKR